MLYTKFGVGRVKIEQDTVPVPVMPLSGTLR